MPQIILKQPGQPVSDFSVSGARVTVAGITVDCAQRQTDSSVCVEIRSNHGVPSEGGDGAYLAQIDIPARSYAGIESVALDPNAVTITLWPTAA
jgi:hypothetical protein